MKKKKKMKITYYIYNNRAISVALYPPLLKRTYITYAQCFADDR